MGYFVEVTAYSVKEGAHGGTLGSPVIYQIPK